MAHSDWRRPPAGGLRTGAAAFEILLPAMPLRSAVRWYRSCVSALVCLARCSGRHWGGRVLKPVASVSAGGLCVFCGCVRAAVRVCVAIPRITMPVAVTTENSHNVCACSGVPWLQAMIFGVLDVPDMVSGGRYTVPGLEVPLLKTIIAPSKSVHLYLLHLNGCSAFAAVSKWRHTLYYTQGSRFNV